MKLYDGKEISSHDRGLIAGGLGIAVATGTPADHAGVALN